MIYYQTPRVREHLCSSFYKDRWGKIRQTFLGFKPCLEGTESWFLWLVLKKRIFLVFLFFGEAKEAKERRLEENQKKELPF